MGHDLENITAQVTKEPTVGGSVLDLCHGVASAITAAKESPAALDALAGDLNSAAAPLADLIKGKLSAKEVAAAEALKPAPAPLK